MNGEMTNGGQMDATAIAEKIDCDVLRLCTMPITAEDEADEITATITARLTNLIDVLGVAECVRRIVRPIS